MRRRARRVVYISPHEDRDGVMERLRQNLSPKELERVEVRRLDGSAPVQDGLLYVPHPYVVPGGRFNEMYGWDSYFMQKGLLRDGRSEMARHMTENHLYQVRHYGGKVLNANRAWSLTRSQPPLLSRMVLDVYRHDRDKAWLRQAYGSVEAFHTFWTTGEHLTPRTGLSRFVDTGTGPAPEVVASGNGEYRRAARFFHDLARQGHDVSRYYDRARRQLTEHFFAGERAGREAGYDTSDRFGPFGADTHQYNPVDLNSALYVLERDLATMARELGRPAQARRWERAAARRRRRMRRLMWDEERGMFFDYHAGEGKRSTVEFASTFFPLWAGVATKEQARRVVDNLPRFEAPGGLLTSTRVTGHQWDAPFVWAPLVDVAVSGLRRYGYDAEANALSVRFLSLVLQEFVRRGEVFEKYDAVRSTSRTRVRFGYRSNEAGFGWTNGVVRDLYEQLPASERKKIGAAHSGRPDGR